MFGQWPIRTSVWHVIQRGIQCLSSCSILDVHTYRLIKIVISLNHQSGYKSSIRIIIIIRVIIIIIICWSSIKKAKPWLKFKRFYSAFLASFCIRLYQINCSPITVPKKQFIAIGAINPVIPPIMDVNILPVNCIHCRRSVAPASCPVDWSL